MAKRKRLSPAQSSYLTGEPAAASSAPSAPLGVGTAPIAQVASEASATAALEELSGVLESARSKGLMIDEIPLSQIDENHLVRDRIHQDEDELQGLMASIRARGQQTPIEVVRLSGEDKPYGLISGWRRLEALRRLYAEDQSFDQIKARVVSPEGAEAAYVAMVEENEIRVNLSHYERARIALKAQDMGLYEDLRKAILGLFGNASRTKRSKIASFAGLVAALDEVLQQPAAISEKLGLALAQRLDQEAGFADQLRAALSAIPAGAPEQELAVLQMALEAAGPLSLPVKNVPLKGTTEPDAPSAPNPVPAAPKEAPKASPKETWETANAKLRLSYAAEHGRIELSGEGVDGALLQDLKTWLARR